MTLADLPTYPNVVTVIPNTGIQFLDFGFSAETPDGRKVRNVPRLWGFSLPPSGDDSARPRVPLLVQRDGEEVRAGNVDYDVSFNDVIDFIGRMWVPVPLLREEANGLSYREGPINWARAYLVRHPERDRHGNEFRLVLALDTALIDEFPDTAYLAPSEADAKSGKTFSIPRDQSFYGFLLEAQWMRGWMADAFRNMLEARARQRTGRREVKLTAEQIEERSRGAFDELARYVAFVDLLYQLEILPKVAIVDTFSETRQTYVDVDMVLDLGASRTCGLLVEAEPGSRAADINRAFKLQLRDLSEPEHTYSDPFDSCLEFALARFGDDRHSPRSGRADAFAWPTIVRVGPEAVRLAGRREGSKGRTGMSSPKRYLWDNEPSHQSWLFNGENMDGVRDSFAAQGIFSTLVNDSGRALHRLGRNDDHLPTLLARYARSNLASFALAEVLLQAIGMMNAPAQRLRRQNGDLPRRLRRLILTMPTALSLEERRILKERAEEALELVYLSIGKATRTPGLEGKDPLVWTEGKRPDIELKWDEASATQVVYLYSQIALAYSGDARAFIDAVRGGKTEGRGNDTLRVATIDMGGGTTDLVVTELEAQGQGANVTIFPHQLFRESFTVAGDDIVHRIIKDVLVRAFSQQIERLLGRDRTDTLVQTLFGGDSGDMTSEQQLQRQQFATQIAAPVAVGLLDAYEAYDPFNPPADEERFLRAFFPVDAPPPRAIVAVIEDAVREAGGEDFVLEDMPVPVRMTDIDRIVRNVVKEPLEALAEIAWRYHADVLLLSGRPSRFPAVRDVVVETGSVPAHRIVSLHEFRVGQWYPFRDSEARIADPKTTAAVGGMLCLLAEGNLHNFNFRSDFLRASSVARFLGKVENSNRLLDQDVYYANLDLEDPNYRLPEAKRPQPGSRERVEGGFEFRGPMALGVRQFPREWWPATLLYNVDYADDDARRRTQPRTPLWLQLVRPESAHDALVEEGQPLPEVNDVLMINREIEDFQGESVRPGMVRLRLQTLRNRDGYWLDTGILVDI